MVGRSIRLPISTMSDPTTNPISSKSDASPQPSQVWYVAPPFNLALKKPMDDDPVCRLNLTKDDQVEPMKVDHQHSSITAPSSSSSPSEQPSKQKALPEQYLVPLIDKIGDHLTSINVMLNNMSAEARSDFDRQVPSMLKLYNSMAEFLLIAVGGANQLYEKITSLSLTDTHLGRMDHVVKGSRGADMVCANGTVEDKTSTSGCITNGYKTNWIFGVLKAENKSILYKKLLQKMSAAVVFKSVMKHSCIVLNTYVIPGEFMAQYLTRKTTIHHQSSKTINLGCERCRTCQHYHRILALVAWSKIKTQWVDLMDGIDPDMLHIDAKIPSQCNRLSAHQKQFLGLIKKP